VAQGVVFRHVAGLSKWVGRTPGLGSRRVVWFAGLEISMGLAGMWTGTRDPERLRVIPWRAFPSPPGVVVCFPGCGRRCRGRGGKEEPFPGKVSFRAVERV